jgi:hypothetical protein
MSASSIAVVMNALRIGSGSKTREVDDAPLVAHPRALA